MKKEKIGYGNITLTLAISIVASLYILFHGKTIDLRVALIDPRFYLAFITSFCLTFFLIYVVYCITRRLDQLYAWYDRFIKRLSAQLVLGVFVPLAVEIILISIYFMFLGTDVIRSGYLQHDFPLIVLFVVIVNLYFTVMYYRHYTSNGKYSRLPTVETDIPRWIAKTGNIYAAFFVTPSCRLRVLTLIAILTKPYT